MGRGEHVNLLMWVMVIALAAVTLIGGAAAGGKSYIVVSMLLVSYVLLPFFILLERRRSPARELVLLAVMIALAVAARAAFVWIPNFKPMAAVVMIAGIALGPSSGFVVGALAALVSNFIFGQGPWTPWQMLSFGLCGLAFGILAKRGVIARADWTGKMRMLAGLLGGLFVLFVAGPVLDTCSVFLMLSEVTLEGAAVIYLAGVPVNAMQAGATFLTLFLAGGPVLEKLRRVEVKYGLDLP